MEGDEGFVGYNPQTVDPGSTLIVATAVFCLLMTLLLPVLLCLREKSEKFGKSTIEDIDRKEDNEAGEEDDHEDDEETLPPPTRAGIHPIPAKSVASSAEGSSFTTSSQIHSAVSSIMSSSRIRGRRRRKGRQDAMQRLKYLNRKDDEFANYVHGNYTSPTDTNPIEVAFAIHPSSPQPNTNDDVSVLNSCYHSSSCSSDSAETIQDMEGQRHCWIDTILEVAKFDHEMKRIFQLGIPFATQALATSILELATVGVIGHLLGTRELAAYVTVTMCLEFTADILGGVQEALTTLCSQAIGTGNNKLAGQYVQLSIVLYIFFAIPLFTFWVFFIGPTILWLGFDEETAQIGKDYAYVLIIDLVILSGIWESIHGLLDVIGRQNYSMVLAVGEDMAALIAMIFAASLGDFTLRDFGLIDIGVGIIFLVVNTAYIKWKGWFSKFAPGLYESFALKNANAVYLMSKQSLSLSLGLLLTEGEWEVLAIFASFLGPAEVAAWGIIGTLWGSVEYLIESIGDAAEVRVAFLLGSGQPKVSKLSAYKSIVLSICIALIVVSVVFIFAEEIPEWLTNDPTLQYMIDDLIPLFGIGSISLTMGSVCWTIIGAQGKYRLATLVVLVASITITLPAAAIFSIVLNINLQGQMAAVVVGYMVSGTVNGYILFRTDWEVTSRIVIEQNSNEASFCSSSSSSSLSSSSGSGANSCISLGSSVSKEVSSSSIYGGQSLSDPTDLTSSTESSKPTTEKKLIHEVVNALSLDSACGSSNSDSDSYHSSISH